MQIIYDPADFQKVKMMKHEAEKCEECGATSKFVYGRSSHCYMCGDHKVFQAKKMNFSHFVSVSDTDGESIGTLEPADYDKDGKPVAWCFIPSSRPSLIAQEELEAIAAKLRELNQAARPGGEG